MKITIETAIKLIKQSNGRIFCVRFTKKDGTFRQMVCRTGVKKHLKGGELSYDPKEFDLLPVFDVEAKGYRMIQTQTMQSIVIDGVEMEII